ncbi:MAG: DUF3617 family protein [Alphaproteobacteria bacterium]|nr:DUF3617 family protein [Alphaproteobacteria bacterium]MBU1513416.1 DUF3617 family protein [Alphaproteobacteria bacterium]MBU2096408.1 DUF3617 family protein [Alphaproteobacteria bacterium]MBU2149900.1 DUF3617 family protein [Alphaproteobacteria bacterium]MBU2308194.1 DUF3617 family protein [Alphaproteobacteria bacterium]
MRMVAVLGVSLLALAACSKKDDKTAAATGEASPAAASASSGPMAPPKRKPGLWAQTATSQGSTQSMTLCLDEATEAKLTVWGGQATADMCPKNVITRTPGGFTFDSECNLGGAGKVVTKGVATGDFNSKYVIKATSVTTGSSMAQANGTHDMEMTGEWKGACPAGAKPGDMSLPGGVTMNINQIAGMKK